MIEIKPITERDREWIAAILTEAWGSKMIAVRGELLDAGGLPGFVAWCEGARVGAITYRIANRECEVSTLNSEVIGAGSLLVDAVRRLAIEKGCERIWLITTNDNIGALRFYQKIGFQLKAVYPNSLEVARRLKPSIPLIGIGGIPLRDEIELEMWL